MFTEPFNFICLGYNRGHRPYEFTRDSCDDYFAHAREAPESGTGPGLRQIPANPGLGPEATRYREPLAPFRKPAENMCLFFTHRAKTMRIDLVSDDRVVGGTEWAAERPCTN